MILEEIMNLANAFNENAIRVNADIKDSHQLLREIAEIACLHPVLKDASPDAISGALEERETLASTGLGNGVALPHCRLPNISSFAVGMVTTKKGIDFHSIDGERVNIFPFVIGPEENPKEHLKALSGMARLLRNPDTRSRIRAAESSSDLYALLKSILEDTSDEGAKPLKTEMRMLHVFVKNEELFNDVLQVFASGEPTGAMVLEAHESTEYLSHLPVFAGFWNNDLNNCRRIIVAVVKGTLLNQALRNIEYVCGDLRKQKDILVTVTDLHHALGSLES